MPPVPDDNLVSEQDSQPMRQLLARLLEPLGEPLDVTRPVKDQECGCAIKGLAAEVVPPDPDELWLVS